MKRNTLTVHAALSVLLIRLVSAGLPLVSVSAVAAERRIKLSEEHIAAINRQRRTIVNYEGRFVGPPFVCKGVELDELVKRHFSFLDRCKPFIDSVWWCFDNGHEAIYPSKILPPYKYRKFQKWHAEGVDFVRVYLEETKKLAAERGYVETLLGRRRYFPELGVTSRAHAQMRRSAERMAINTPVQGSAADIIKIAMVNLDRELKSDGHRSRMLLQVHDELVLEVPEEELDPMVELVSRVMSSAYELDVPLKVDAKVGRNWLEMEDVK